MIEGRKNNHFATPLRAIPTKANSAVEVPLIEALGLMGMAERLWQLCRLLDTMVIVCNNYNHMLTSSREKDGIINKNLQLPTILPSYPLNGSRWLSRLEVLS